MFNENLLVSLLNGERSFPSRPNDLIFLRDADMPDYHFLIGDHPEHPGLHMAVGGSAHGFKFLPVSGKYVVQSLEGKLDQELASKWRWRPGAKLEGPCPHTTKLIELSEIPGWI